MPAGTQAATRGWWKAILAARKAEEAIRDVLAGLDEDGSERVAQWLACNAWVAGDTDPVVNRLMNRVQELLHVDARTRTGNWAARTEPRLRAHARLDTSKQVKVAARRAAKAAQTQEAKRLIREENSTIDQAARAVGLKPGTLRARLSRADKK